MGLFERFLKNPQAWREASLLTIARVGPPEAQIRVARELAERGRSAPLVRLLNHRVPGVRRAAARGLGWIGDTAAIEGVLADERSDVVRAAMYGALRRAPPARPSIGTCEGPRPILSPFDVPSEADREPGTNRRAHFDFPVLVDGPEGRAALLEHASACPPDLAERLPAVERASGRRLGHAVLEAIGVSGDPRAVPRLIRALEATDVDPGRGFRERHLAAIAFARIGDPSQRGRLIDALRREKRDYEGRPGAGLGIQDPVRCALLWALGELGDARAGRTLVMYLDAVDGHGTHLWAMGALTKVGPQVLPLVAKSLAADEVTAANAAGVIGAYGPSMFADRALTDPRAPVRDAAAVSLGQQPPEDPIDLAIAELQAGHYHGAHDVLEWVWRAAEGQRRTGLQGMIQGATALEHLLRRHPREARSQWAKARGRLRPLGDVWEGVQIGAWCDAMDKLDWDAPPPQAAWPIPTRL